jgi:hypothetical protein
MGELEARIQGCARRNRTSGCVAVALGGIAVSWELAAALPPIWLWLVPVIGICQYRLVISGHGQCTERPVDQSRSTT